MPSSLHRADLAARRAWAKGEVVRRVRAGEAVSGVCRDAGMPHPATVCAWMQADAGFAAAMEAARAEGAAAARAEAERRGRFDPEAAAAFLGRLAAGEDIRALYRDPALPSAWALDRWRREAPGFGAEVARVIAARRASRVARGVNGRRPPREWDEAVAERVLYLVGQGHRVEALRRVDPAAPGRPVVERWRRARPDFDFDFRVNALMGRLARRRVARHALLERLEEGLWTGGSLKSLGGTGGLPRAGTLYAWMRRDRVFSARVLQACDERDYWFADKMRDLLMTSEGAGLSVAELRRRVAGLMARGNRLQARPRGWRPDPPGLPKAWPVQAARWGGTRRRKGRGG